MKTVFGKLWNRIKFQQELLSTADAQMSLFCVLRLSWPLLRISDRVAVGPQPGIEV
jgi:hypothetical protein